MKKRKPVKLTPQQIECVKYPPDQPLLVRGIPGSGKTTVLLERAQFLDEVGERDQNAKIVFLTYNSMLALYVRQLALESGDNQVQATTFHGWGLKLLADLGITSRGGVLKEAERWGLIKYACATVIKYKSHLKAPPMPGSRGQDANSWAVVKEAVEFLGEEIGWIKGLGKDQHHYMTEPRTGRGSTIHVLTEHRAWIWEVYETFQSMLGQRSQFEFDDVARLLDLHIKRIPDHRRPAHILIDEAQDLTVMQLKVLAKLTRRSITIAADKGQSIYQRSFSWTQLGINIRGRSKSLEQTFRSTRQIIRLARSLQRFDPIVLKRDEEFVQGVEPDNDGPIPELFMARNLDDQVNQVANWVADRHKSFPEDTIAVVIPGKTIREKYEAELNRRGIPWVNLKMESGADILSAGVKLVTFYSAKGLEFDHVAVTSLKDGLLPKNPPKEASREDKEELLATERRKVYVAFTRAKLSLGVFGVGSASPFIAELDTKLYRRMA